MTIQQRLSILQALIAEVYDDCESQDELEEVGAMLLGASAQIGLGGVASGQCEPRDARAEFLECCRAAFDWALDRLEEAEAADQETQPETVDELVFGVRVNSRGGDT